MSDFPIREIPGDYPMAIVRVGWKIAKLHYPLIFGTSFFFICVAIATSVIPVLGLFSAIPILFLSLGQFSLIRELIAGNPAKFSDMFRAFQNPKWLEALIPLAIACLFVSLLQAGVTRGMNGDPISALMGSFISMTLTLVWYALAGFSGPLIIFRGKKFAASIELNLKVTVLNWFPLLMFTLLLLGLGLLCLLCFFLPLFFVFAPVAFVASYLCYACLFEGLDVKALEIAYESKPTV